MLLDRVVFLVRYSKAFGSLNLQKNRNQWSAETNHCAPYMPILLLAVIDLIAEEKITSNLIEITPELGELFASYWSLIRPVMPPERRMGDLALPFYHLRSDGFWHLVPRAGKETIVKDRIPRESAAVYRDQHARLISCQAYEWTAEQCQTIQAHS